MNVANIKMQAGFKSENIFSKRYQNEFFYVHNLELFNSCFTHQNLIYNKDFYTCIGVWKIKKLK